MGSLQSVAGSAFLFFPHTIDLMQNDVTRSDVKRSVNYGLCGHRAGKYFKMATVGRECFEVLNRLLEAVQTNEDSSSFENSCPSPLWLNNYEIQWSSQLSTSNFTRRSGGAGGNTCCVSDCSSNHKRNPELSFYSILSGKSEESKELRKRWVNLISRKDFSPTIGHRVRSLHFPGGRKTYLNQLPTIVPKATRPTPTKPLSTVKARNRILVQNLYLLSADFFPNLMITIIYQAQ